VKLYIQRAAEADIIRQVEWYVKQGLKLIAGRFQAAVLMAIDALLHMRNAGAPKDFANPLLAGMLSWSYQPA
jgi:hypothetical protein